MSTRKETAKSSRIVMKIVDISFSMLVMLILIVVLYKVGEKSYDFGYRVFRETAVATEAEGEDKLVQVTGDMGAKEIGDLLEEKGLIRDSNLFVVQLKLSAYANKIKEGTYTLSTAMTSKEMMQVMSAEVVEDTEMEE